MSANTVAIRSAIRNALTDCTAGDLILVAVSGGADSLALAYALSLEAPKLALRVEGSGARSLSAMAVRNGKYLRPLLSITREETLGACAEAQLDPWDDPHNADKTFTRVRVRTDVIPNLEKNLGPGISAALARTASLLRDDADALDQLAEQEFSAHDPKSLEISRLEKLPKAIRTRVLRMAIYAAGAPSGSLSADHITPIEALITDWSGQGPSDLPGGVRVSRISGRLSLSR